MTPLLDLWWTWVSIASVQAALLIPVVAMLDRWWGTRRWPSLQAVLWAVVMLRLVTPPVVSAIVPQPVIDRVSIEALTRPLAPLPVSSSAIVQQAFLLWLSVAIVGAAWTWLRYRRVRAWCGRGARAPEDLVALAAGAAARLGVTRMPAIVVHDEILVPAAIGLRNPLIVLPTALVRSGSRQDIEHVLLHELAHVRRHDALRAAVSIAIQILYWFHPLVWIARARLTALREIACDREVARVADSRDEYRRTLIRLARPLARPSSLVAGVGLFARRSDLLTRLDLLARPGPSSSRGARVCLLTMGVVATSMLVVVEAAAVRRSASADADAMRFNGCLQLRYAVYAALAQEAAAQKGQ
jgi:bla regulator protein BlaR1